MAGVVVALALGAGCSTSILHGLDERGANETVAALERAGIGADKQVDDDGVAAGSASAVAFKVRVGHADEPRALEVLRGLGLPRDRRHGFAEVYGQPSLIPTASEERARYLDALAGEVARTLEVADGVVSARVHLVPAEIDPLAGDGKPHTPARAAGLIKARRPAAGVAGQPHVAGGGAGDRRRVADGHGGAAAVHRAPAGGAGTAGGPAHARKRLGGTAACARAALTKHVRVGDVERAALERGQRGRRHFLQHAFAGRRPLEVAGHRR